MSHGYTKEQALDTDITLAFNSDYLAASQAAVKAFVENSLNARLSASEATDLTDGGTTTLHSHSGGSGHVIQEEGTPLTARANLNFVGNGVTATDDAGNDATIITIPVGLTANLFTGMQTIKLAAVTDPHLLLGDVAALHTEYKPAQAGYQIPLYLNTGGMGDRTASITATTDLTIGGGVISALLNGTTANTFYFNGQAASGKYLKFNFVTARKITEAKWYQSNASTHGSWKWQGSNDDSAWTDIGVAFTWGGATVQTQTELAGNTTGYIYYRLLGVSGSVSGSPYSQEMEFKIGGAVNLAGIIQGYNATATIDELSINPLGGGLAVGGDIASSGGLKISGDVTTAGSAYFGKAGGETPILTVSQTGVSFGFNVVPSAAKFEVNATTFIIRTLDGSTSPLNVAFDNVVFLAKMALYYGGGFTEFRSLEDAVLSLGVSGKRWKELYTAKIFSIGSTDVTNTILRANSTQSAASRMLSVQNSSITEQLYISGDYAMVGNVQSGATADFTWNTDNYVGLFLDASNDSVVLMSNAAGKVGFYGATAIIQPTTAIAASTFTANTSGIVDDTATFDGYTIGQVVKSLRNLGVLA